MRSELTPEQFIEKHRRMQNDIADMERAIEIRKAQLIAMRNEYVRSCEEANTAKARGED